MQNLLDKLNSPARIEEYKNNIIQILVRKCDKKKDINIFYNIKILN